MATTKEDTNHRALQSNLHKALDLECRLNASSNSNNKTSSNTNETNILRANLCGTLADILLLDPDVAHAKNVVGRLWRHCFYARIAPTRARLAKLAAKQQTAEYKKRKEGLQEFLQEGVDLYKYLQAKLREQLTEGRTSTESTSGLVPCLHRCTIHLGDLYRYAEQTPLATECYTTAAALAPGSGHPWNQVAVAATQTNDRVLDTVYWYVRALGASVDPFPTAQANCLRIVSMYQKTTQHQPANTGGGVVLAGTSTRLFLGQLVCEIVDSATAEGDAKVDDAQHNRRLELVQQFENFLQAGIFSDALVLKLMCILLYFKKNNQELLLPIAATIAARCHSLVASKVTKAIPCYGCRGLVVLTVVAEYFLLFLGDKDDTDAYRQPHAFWKELVATYNLLQSQKSGPTTPSLPLPERQELRGFLRPTTLFVKDTEAAALLGSGESEDSASVANTTTTTATESDGVARNRTAHFLQLPLDEHLDFVERQPDGSLEYTAVEEEDDAVMMGMEDDEKEEFGLGTFMPSMEQAASAVPLVAAATASPSLVYKTTGNGPALLVPTMFTAAPTPPPAPAAPPASAPGAPVVPTVPPAVNPLDALLGPSRLPPPPGFGPSSAPPRAATMPNLLGTSWAQQQSVVTDNPFAQQPQSMIPFGSFAAPQQQHHHQQQQPQYNDNRLLRNLLLGESSQSPFAG